MREESFIQTAADIAQCGHLHQIGGKAMGLARLDKANANVPSWFVITTQAFLYHLEQANVLQHFEEHLSSEQTAEIQQRIKNITFKPEFVCQIERALAGIGPGPYAVRSSMVDEDSQTLSYAGQLDTNLNQNNLDDVITSIKECWASCLNERVVHYRQNQINGFDLPVMGLVVQQMITTEISGVSFSAHPITGKRDNALITAAWGLGEGVVSGLCNADEYTCTHTGQLIDVRIAKKDLSIQVTSGDISGVTQITVPQDQQQIACLHQEQIQRLVEETARIAKLMGCPQDIEWGISEGELFLLQSRPITALPSEQNTDGPVHVFDNSNIQESYCGVTTPLTFSFAARAYHSVYNQTMSALGFSETEIQQHDERHRHLLALVKGRIYYNINNWYRGLLLLPGFGRNKADMERMMGLTDPVDFIEDQTLTTSQKIKRIPGLCRTVVNLFRAIRKLDKSVPAWLESFEHTYAKLDRSSFKTASFSRLMEWLSLLDDEVLNHWHTPIINDFAVMIYSGRLRRTIESLNSHDPDVLIQQLLSGEEGIESTEPTRILLQLAHKIANELELAALLKQGQYNRALETFPSYPEINTIYQNYIERYGDRTIGELKLETISLREDPTFVFDILKNYLCNERINHDEIQYNEVKKRRDAEQLLKSSLPWWQRTRVLRLLDRTRAAIKHRENMRLTRTRAFGLARDLYLAIGQRLFEYEQLSNPRDIFYLTVEEIRDLYKGRSVTTHLNQLTKLRKKEFLDFELVDMPHQFQTVGPVYFGNNFQAKQHAKSTSDANSMSGIGCYPGVVEGQVKIIRDPRDSMEINGQILVAERTDPGWTPLFPSCSGILVERGSTLSHSAIIARELGIPAIVGIPNLMQSLSDSDLVRLDGASGEVTRLTKSSSAQNKHIQVEYC